MPRGAKWTDKQVQVLIEHWPTTPKEELLKLLPEFSYNALKKKAHRLGLKKTKGISDKQPSEKELLKRLEAQGYHIVKTAPITDHVYDLNTARYDGEPVKIGVISDTHLGSKHQQLTHLKQIYQRFAEEGIEIVLHAGDISQGIKMFRGWEMEAFLHDFDSQAEYIVKNYPKHPGITTYVILGNHDESFLKNGGGNICKLIASQREDIVHLGDYGAYITLPGGMIAYLHHGAGGCAYARSYKLQKAVENFSPGKKPKLYISGHYHVTALLPDYRNVYAMHPGCFQGQGLFLRRLGLSPDVGGFIIEYAVNPDSSKFDLAYIRSEWIPFRKEMANDY